MLFFGHIGIGRKLLEPWRAKLPAKYVAWGTVLPDLIDKPLYYGLLWTVGRREDGLDFIYGTRTLGHSGILLLLLFLCSLRSKKCLALSLGVVTHLLLDLLGDLGDLPNSATLKALFFPFLGGFGIAPFKSLAEHLYGKLNLYVVVGESTGIWILLKEYKLSKKKSSTINAPDMSSSK